ncbi:hypothetical protein EJ05DRAFT_517267, partial [Pseudovirgaria hyperparasitica]
MHLLSVSEIHFISPASRQRQMEQTNILKQPPHPYLIKWKEFEAKQPLFPLELIKRITKLVELDKGNCHVMNELIRQWYKEIANDYIEENQKINPYFGPPSNLMHPDNSYSNDKYNAWPCTAETLDSYRAWVDSSILPDLGTVAESVSAQHQIKFASLGELGDSEWLEENPWGYRQPVYNMGCNLRNTLPDEEKVQEITVNYKTLSEGSEDASKALLDKVIAVSDRHPITKIVAFGLGPLDSLPSTEFAFNEKKACVYQHEFVISLQEKLTSKYDSPVQLVLQDTSYTPAAKKVLESRNESKAPFVTYHEGLIHIDDATLVFWHSLDGALPMPQVLTGLPLPAAIICEDLERYKLLKEELERQGSPHGRYIMPSMQPSPRSEKMFNKYDRYEVDYKLDSDRLGEILVPGHKRRDHINTIDLFVRSVREDVNPVYVVAN